MKDKDTKLLEEKYEQLNEYGKRRYDDDSEWYDVLQRRSGLDPETYEKGEEYESKIRALEYKMEKFLADLDLRKEIQLDPSVSKLAVIDKLLDILEH